jgi:radical SAM superfamily enzyme YgiQ (UPF0313 family)
MKIVLISTYHMGQQPFGLASPKAWLERDGHEVVCCDLSVSKLREPAVRGAGMIAFYLPMHTATRLALPVIERVKRLNASARLVCYGLYAPLNKDLLLDAGVNAVIGGEFEAALCRIARGETAPEISVERQAFLAPDRTQLATLDRYAKFHSNGETRLVAYTEASRGCKHLCRHCPVVPVYQGKFRIVEPEVVLEDIRRQVAAGARHVTFGDPDFLNGPRHALRIVEALHREFPGLTYDATIKIEHLRKHRDLIRPLKQTGCALVTSAVESFDDQVLEKLAKNHTRADFLQVAGWMGEENLPLQPTFIAFTPWTTLESYRDMLRILRDQNLAGNVAPVQLALRLLVTSGSKLLDLPEIESLVGPFDFKALGYPWKHPDPAVDGLADRVFAAVAQAPRGATRWETFAEIWRLADAGPLPENFELLPRAAIPYLDEPWYC